MSIDRLGKELDALGVSGRDVHCLLLLPQVYAGWQGRQRNLPALEALLDSTSNRAGFGAQCQALARTWLFERPTRAQFQSAFALLRALRRAPGEPIIRTSDLLESMLWAMRAAQLDREPWSELSREPRPANGRGSVVTYESRRALEQLEAWLEIDTKDLAADLLEDEPPRSSRAPGTARRSDSGIVMRSADPAAPPSAPFPLVRKHA
jgi:hypothetical protein